ncbi:hypothetical protein FHX49_002062 [Microbacterium endophyticum]|uniref:Uncharacterized protein n=1 Tax=Microbacterium endophyticum TaxID=1526412 RepID=A0A7W4V425_9MICO|nr:hypothetical protein [Microbacterium endophyticum]MBB2976487.1 hypothetical protein [Microbacterium endophyticum]NIK35933.1 hypothetical protein [Microbacterium endophyticum]
MNDEVNVELRALRARAYGPNADLHDDPEALRRLQELEAMSRGADAAPDPDEMTRAAPSPAEEFLASPELQPDPEPALDVEPALADESTQRTKWSARRIGMVWLASVVAAVVVATAVTAVVSRRVQADPQEIAVLTVDPTAELPGILVGSFGDAPPEASQDEQGRGFTDFFGLSAFAVSGQLWGYSGDDECLVLGATAGFSPESDSFEGPLYSGCSAGGFPATLQFVVSNSVPQELRDAYPEGTAFQFILDGSEVIVLSDAE